MGFYEWIAVPTAGTNIQSDSDFSGDSQRTNGFTTGTTVSSIRMNTVLRQCSLVTAAIMRLADSQQSLSAGSSLNDVKSSIENYLRSLTPSLQSVPNVSLTINGKAISSIFEADGITAKNSTRAETANKLGSSTVGTLQNPIYLSDGTPQPCTKLYEHCIYLESTSSERLCFSIIASKNTPCTTYNDVKSLFVSTEKYPCSGIIKDLTSQNLKPCYCVYKKSSGLAFKWADAEGLYGERILGEFPASWTISDIISREVR